LRRLSIKIGVALGLFVWFAIYFVIINMGVFFNNGEFMLIEPSFSVRLAEMAAAIVILVFGIYVFSKYIRWH